MLKGLTNTFKNNCNNKVLIYKEYLVLNETIIPIKAELNDDTYENGNFIGTFIFKTIKFETDAQYDFKDKEFEYYKVVNNESIKIGTFITTEVEINDTNEIIKVVGMDYGLKTQIPYKSTLDYSSGTITLLDVWNEACTLSGLTSGIDSFTNSNFIVDNDQFTGTGATIRDVFKGIAMSSGSFVKVMNDDKIYLIFNGYTSDLETAMINGSGSINDGFATNNFQVQGKSEQDGTPTPTNPVEIKTVSGIENLFDKDNVSSLNAYFNTSTNKITQSGAGVKSLYIPCEANTTYTVQKTLSTRFGVACTKAIPVIGETIYNASVHATWNNITITTDSQAKYLVVEYYISSDTITEQEILDTIQIEKSTTAHQYVPYGHWLPIKIANSNDASAEDYQEQITLIDLNKYNSNNEIIGNYELCSIGENKDLLTIKDGSAVITKNINKIVLNGSESYTQVNVVENNTMYRTTNAIFVGLPNNTTNYITNYFSTNTASYSSSTIGSYIYNNQFRMRVPSSITNINTWLATHNTNIYYKLSATETITLKGTYNISLYEGINYITIYDDLEPIIVLSYYNTNLDIIEDYVELEDKRDTHPWTCLRLGMSQIEGENIDYVDEDLVAKYGENWLILNDNPFAYNQSKRQELITAIFNRIKGFGYSSFVSKTSFKPYLTTGDIIKFRNREGDLVKTILLRYIHKSEELELSAPSETSATVNYVYPLTVVDMNKRTEIIVDKATGDIKLLSDTTNNLVDSLKNVYTIDQTNELIANAETGVTNTFSKAGGNNIFRNTGLWFEQSDNNNPYEYWNGIVVRVKEEKASNMNALQLQSGTVYQNQEVPNGQYTVSFKYKKLIHLAQPKVYINDVEYELTEEEDTEFEQIIEVSAKYINIRFTTDINDSCEIYDLMVNAGTVKLAYSQNQNETTTDTVNISKGITITTSDSTTKFKANADGIRTLDRNDNVLTEFTDTGMTTKEAIIQSKSQIVGTLWQEVGEQTWITRL